MAGDLLVGADAILAYLVFLGMPEDTDVYYLKRAGRWPIGKTSEAAAAWSPRSAGSPVTRRRSPHPRRSTPPETARRGRDVRRALAAMTSNRPDMTAAGPSAPTKQKRETGRQKGSAFEMHLSATRTAGRQPAHRRRPKLTTAAARAIVAAGLTTRGFSVRQASDLACVNVSYVNKVRHRPTWIASASFVAKSLLVTSATAIATAASPATNRSTVSSRVLAPVASCTRSIG